MRRKPEPACVCDGTTGDVISYSELDRQSRKLARYLNEQGIVPGDHLAIMMNNNKDYFVVCWAAQRLGLIYTPINWHLAASEVAYIVQNCEAKILVVSEEVRHVADAISQDIPGVKRCPHAWASFREVSQSREVIESTSDGSGRLASWRATACSIRPAQQAVRRASSRWNADNFRGGSNLLSLNSCAHFTDSIVTPSIWFRRRSITRPAFAWSMNVLRAGGTVVVVNKFDSLETLRLVETYRVTHSQFVPTMFVRMLRLPEAERTQYDILQSEGRHSRGGTLSARKSNGR